MGQGYVAPRRGNSVAPIVNRLRAQQRLINEQGVPSGPNLSELYDQVQAALANIDATVQTSISVNSYTKAVIDSKIASPGAIAPTSVTASGDLRGVDIYATNAPAFNITGTRVAGWWESSTGRGGTASSSLRFKEILQEDALAGEELALAILSASIVFYQYKAELAKRDDPDSPDYVGPEYKVHTEVGMIAERLHEAGLWPFVVYEREGAYREDPTGEVDPETGEPITRHVYLGDTLKLNENGEPIPYGIHYEMFSIAVLAAAQWLFARYTDLDNRVRALEGINS